MIAVDLFAGCGGLSVGLERAGFNVIKAVEIDPLAAKTYRLNHPSTDLIESDIREIADAEIRRWKKLEIDLVAGCPPCQGFSSVRRLNRDRNVRDPRNSLVLEFARFVRILRPKAFMLENVPGLVNYGLFQRTVSELKSHGYEIVYDVVNIKEYGVPQSRRRLVMVGSRVGTPSLGKPTGKSVTVRDAIGKLGSPARSKDEFHKIYYTPSDRIKRLISLIPKNGGSRTDLPNELILDCHKKKDVGFNDVYGRLRWDGISTTITGGCLNPSKGRFLHPVQNRSITAREASLLQSFPSNYKWPLDAPKQAIALMIGNALPPKFSYWQSLAIAKHLSSSNGT